MLDPREIAVRLFGEAAVDWDLAGPSDWMRSCIRLGENLARIGYRRILDRTYVDRQRPQGASVHRRAPASADPDKSN